MHQARATGTLYLSTGPIYICSTYRVLSDQVTPDADSLDDVESIEKSRDGWIFELEIVQSMGQALQEARSPWLKESNYEIDWSTNRQGND